MKKTSQGNNSSKPGVRSAYTPSTVYRTTGPSHVSGGPSRKPNSRKNTRKKKNSGAKAAIAIVAVVAVLGGGTYAAYRTGLLNKILPQSIQEEEKYQLTAADGTVVEMTESQLREMLSVTTYPQGIIVDGVNIGGMTRDEALASLNSAAPEAPITTNISLELDGTTYPLDLSTLTFSSNVEEILDNAYNQYALNGTEDINALIQNYNVRESLKQTPSEYTSAYTLSTEGISEIVHGMLDDMSSEAVEAQVTGFNTETLTFEYTESARGYVIDIDTAANDVKALLDSGVYEGVVVVNAEITEPNLTTEMMENEFGRISTASSQANSSSGRNHNIQTAAERIDGYVLQPGETFSFNGFIGQRTAANGFALAGTIQNGTIEQDYGGGICQVTSMIYQSVVKANLFDFNAGYNSEGQERHEHMWPSFYAVPGTDAAVDWPLQDFKFTNLSDYPIALHLTWNPDTITITAEIYGHLLPDGQYIEFVGNTIGRQSATTEYIADPNSPVGSRTSIRGSHDGVTAESFQVWHDADGNEIERIELPTSHYATVNAQISVGVRNPDGSLASMAPDGTVTGGVETPVESETTPSDTVPGETTAVVSDPTATPAESTAAPTEATAAPTEATAAPTEATAAPTEAAPADPPPAEAGE